MIHAKINNDLLLRFLMRLQTTPLKIGVIVAVLFNLPFFFYAFITNHLFSDGKTIGLLVDINYILLNILVVPATWAYYLWLPSGIDKVIQQMKTKNIFSNKGQLNLQISRLASEQDKAFWYILAFLLAAFFQLVFLVPQHLNFKNILGSSLLLLILYELMYFPVYYATLAIAFRALSFVWWIGKVFRELKITIFPLHPDKAGGLSFIGKYIANTGYIIGLWGFAITVVIFTEGIQLQGSNASYYIEPLTLIPLLALVILAPFGFFVPMWQVHLAMVKARDQWIEKISKEYNMILKKLPHLDSVDKITELEKLHVSVSKSPVYPFQTPDLIAYLTRVWGSIVLPALSAWIGSLLD